MIKGIRRTKARLAALFRIEGRTKACLPLAAELIDAACCHLCVVGSCHSFLISLSSNHPALFLCLNQSRCLPPLAKCLSSNRAASDRTLNGLNIFEYVLTILGIRHYAVFFFTFIFES